jgi:hypothetical protein
METELDPDTLYQNRFIDVLSILTLREELHEKEKPYDKLQDKIFVIENLKKSSLKKSLPLFATNIITMEDIFYPTIKILR